MLEQDFGILLATIPRDAQMVVRESGHRGRSDETDLVLAWCSPDGAWFKAILGLDQRNPRRVLLRSLYGTDTGNIDFCNGTESASR